MPEILRQPQGCNHLGAIVIQNQLASHQPVVYARRQTDSSYQPGIIQHASGPWTGRGTMPLFNVLYHGQSGFNVRYMLMPCDPNASFLCLTVVLPVMLACFLAEMPKVLIKIRPFHFHAGAGIRNRIWNKWFGPFVPTGLFFVQKIEHQE